MKIKGQDFQGQSTGGSGVKSAGGKLSLSAESQSEDHGGDGGSVL